MNVFLCVLFSDNMDNMAPGLVLQHLQNYCPQISRVSHFFFQQSQFIPPKWERQGGGGGGGANLDTVREGYSKT